MHSFHQSPGIKSFLASLVLTTVPFLVVTFVPVTDLPQHLAQARLFWETLAGAQPSHVVINWWAPNNLIYLLLVPGWKVLPPVLLGRLTILLLALAWVASVHVLARKRNRPVASAVLASVFVFNASLYWGFLSFLLGWPFFVLLLAFALDGDAGTLRPAKMAQGAALFLLLLFSHALWFLVGSSLIVLIFLVERRPLERMVRFFVPALPAVLTALVWFPRFAESRARLGFDTSASWGETFLERLSPSWITNAALGGLRSPLEYVIVGAVFLWLGMGLYGHRRNLRKSIDRPLLTAGIAVIAFSLLGPEKYMNTIYFSSRWFPIGLTCLLLAVPSPVLTGLKDVRVLGRWWMRPGEILVGFALVVQMAFVVGTTSSWRAFEYAELYGFDQALSSIPEGSNVLGLDFYKTSAVLKGRPFLQEFAYAQVLHGGLLNFSFTWHQSGIVADTSPVILAHTPGLEWFAERVRTSDVSAFDVILVNGDDYTQARFVATGLAEPISAVGRWRAFKTLHEH